VVTLVDGLIDANNKGQNAGKTAKD
jgi:hypothetical protein